jgi:hypothetical protein
MDQPADDAPAVRIEEIEGEAVATVDHSVLLRCDPSAVVSAPR